MSPGVTLTILTEPSEGTNVNGCRSRRVEEPQAGTTALQSNARPRTSASTSERLEEIARSLHAEQEPAPAVFPGRGLIKGEVGDRGRGLADGGLAERIGLEAVAAGELDEVDQMAFQLGKRQLHPPRGRRQAPPAALLADHQRGDGRQAEDRPDREQADQHALGQPEQGVGQHEEHERCQRDRRGQDGAAPERERPPLEPGLPQPAVTTSAWGDMVGVS